MQGVNMDELKVRLDFSKFPHQFTCDGANTSPKVEITGGKGMCLAMILDDPDAPSGTFTHWVIWNVVPVGTIPENMPRDKMITHPISAVQGMNSGARMGYTGPCPPGNHPHRYFFKVYVLDKMLNIPTGSKKADLERAMEGHVLQKAETMATYVRV
jgi:Raf kinase inhibitor-like YbhB/YbcL family protein